MSLLRRLGFGRHTERPRLLAAATALGFYAEAQMAGWVAAPAELSAAPAKAAAGNGDPEGLLGRFYESQEC
jgi:hypothetical protein